MMEGGVYARCSCPESEAVSRPAVQAVPNSPGAGAGLIRRFQSARQSTDVRWLCRRKAQLCGGIYYAENTGFAGGRVPRKGRGTAAADGRQPIGGKLLAIKPHESGSPCLFSIRQKQPARQLTGGHPAYRMPFSTVSHDVSPPTERSFGYPAVCCTGHRQKNVLLVSKRFILHSPGRYGIKKQGRRDATVL